MSGGGSHAIMAPKLAKRFAMRLQAVEDRRFRRHGGRSVGPIKESQHSTLSDIVRKRVHSIVGWAS
jgi:hypothetical protein